MWIPIKNHAFLWSMRRKRGIVKLELIDETEHKAVVKSTRQFLIIIEILRGGKAVFYNPLSGSISSSWETLQKKPKPGEKSSQEYKAAFDKGSDETTEDITDLTSEDFDPTPTESSD